jgi:hypothetical protein
MSQSALDKLTTVGTEFNYWGVGYSSPEGATKLPDGTFVRHLIHAKVITSCFTEKSWECGNTYIITAKTDDEGIVAMSVNLENIDDFDIDWEPDSVSDFTPKDIVIEALDLLYETQAHNIDNYVNDEDDITLEDIAKAKFWAEECGRITKIHYPEEFTR